MTVKQLRTREIENSIRKIKDVLRNQVNIESLEEAKTTMLQLASKRDLFPWIDFPTPSDEEIYRTFLVYQENDGSYALYVNSSLPGQQSPPHDHGGSWAIVAAVEGEELHKVYKKDPDVRHSNVCPISLAGEILVKPGNAISLLPEGIHSIQMETSAPLLHLHLYAKGFEFQGIRNEYNLDTGNVKRFKLEEVGIIEDAR